MAGRSLAYNVETDGAGNNFGLATANLALTDNTIGISSGNGGGIWLIDAPQSVLVARNSFYGTNGATIGQCLYAHTDSAIVEGNRWNNTQRLFANPVSINGLQTVALPDIADEVMLSAVPAGVQSIQTLRQLAIAGQIGFIKVTAAAAATPTPRSRSAAAGRAPPPRRRSPAAPSSASPSRTRRRLRRRRHRATVTITGDGTGATPTASVGLPVLEGRRIRIACNTATRFARAGSAPFQDNWTLADA